MFEYPQNLATLILKNEQLEERQNITAKYAVSVKSELDTLTEKFNKLQERFEQHLSNYELDSSKINDFNNGSDLIAQDENGVITFCNEEFKLERMFFLLRLCIYEDDNSEIAMSSKSFWEFFKKVGKLNLQGLNLSNIDLIAKDLKGANLKNVNFQNAKLIETNLDEANLAGADLRGANLISARLSRTILKDAKFSSSTNLSTASLRQVQLQGMCLRELNLSGASLSAANLCGADLSNANLRGADLKNINLCAANLEGANLEKANLNGAYLTEANLYKTNLTGAIMPDGKTYEQS